MLITRRVHGADPPATPEPVLAEAAR
jgi:hypothetical protein